MSVSSIGGRGSVGASTGSAERVVCTGARSRLAAVGFFGYLVVGILFAVALVEVVRAFGSNIGPFALLGIGLAIAVAATWRGATVSVTVRPDGLTVRNRWRTVTVQFGDITEVEVHTPWAYVVVGMALSVWLTFHPGSGGVDLDLIDDPDDVGDTSGFDLLTIRRRGRRRRLRVLATLGMNIRRDEVQPVLDALSSHGHPLTES